MKSTKSFSIMFILSKSAKCTKCDREGRQDMIVVSFSVDFHVIAQSVPVNLIILMLKGDK